MSDRIRLRLGILAIFAGLFLPVLFILIIHRSSGLNLPFIIITLILFAGNLVLVGVATLKNKGMIWRKVLAYCNFCMALYFFGLGFYFIFTPDIRYYPDIILFSLPIFAFGVIPILAGIKLLRKKSLLWALASACALFFGLFYTVVAAFIYNSQFL